MAGFNTLSPEELEQTDPDKTHVVHRDDTQGYKLYVYEVSASAVETEAFTYDDNCGMYRLTNTEATLAADLASILNEIASDSKTIGPIGRPPHEAFEVVVETTGDIDSTDIDVNGPTYVETQVTPESSFAPELDELLEVLSSHVQPD